MKSFRRLPAVLALLAFLFTLPALPVHAAAQPAEWMTSWMSHVTDWLPQSLDFWGAATAESKDCQDPCYPPTESPPDPSSPVPSSTTPPEVEASPLIDPDG